MAKYRKESVIVEAEQWFPGKEIEGVYPIPEGERGAFYAYIRTLEGRMTVSPGDYVITTAQGKRYPCREDIFLAKYEPAGESKP